MKVKSITGDGVASEAPVILGAVGGGMLTNGLVTAVTKNSTNPNMKLFVNLGVLVLATVASSAVTGDDAAGKAAKGAAIGAGVASGLQLVKHFAEKSNVAQKMSSDNTANVFMKGALGLSCPEFRGNYVPNAIQLNRPRRSKHLGQPYSGAPKLEPSFEEILGS